MIDTEVWKRSLVAIATEKKIHLTEATAQSIADYIHLDKLSENSMRSTFGRLKAQVKPNLDGDNILKIYEEYQHASKSRAVVIGEQKQGIGYRNTDSDCAKEYYFVKNYLLSTKARELNQQEYRILMNYIKNTHDESVTIKDEGEMWRYINNIMAKESTLLDTNK